MDLRSSNPDTVPQEHGIASVAGSKLERFLRGFQECVFHEEVDEFVKRYSAEFAVACPDGSCPLIWQNLHQEYREIFDQQLEAVLWFQGYEKDEFLQYCAMAQQCSEGLANEDELPDLFPDNPKEPAVRGILVGEFRQFLASLTASEDFDRFLQVMFAAVSGRLRATNTAPSEDEVARLAAAADPPPPQCHEIDVVVPEGMGPGQLLAVDFLGMRYELQVPEGCGPGTSFRASVTLPG
mmetsp:Transcript_116092/g.248319  ORF Transcript_116092/g.248319 Transcript_116092/m.248319 type:complete len:238 (+) Transcript_116092:76-789(+)